MHRHYLTTTNDHLTPPEDTRHQRRIEATLDAEAALASDLRQPGREVEVTHDAEMWNEDHVWFEADIRLKFLWRIGMSKDELVEAIRAELDSWLGGVLVFVLAKFAEGMK